MARVVSQNISKKYKQELNIAAISFSMIGFKLSHDEKFIDFYYIFEDQIRNRLLVKQSFILDADRMDDEMAYFNHPLHKNIFIDLFKNEGYEVQRNAVSKIMEEFNHNNSYYCDFIPREIINDTYVCTLYQVDIQGENRVRYISMPASIFYKLETIKNNIIFKFPLNPSIDKDTSYDNIHIHDKTNVKFVGVMQFPENKLISLYGLSSGDDMIGVGVLTRGHEGDIVCKQLEKEEFGYMYHNNFIVNISNIMITHTKAKSNIVSRVAIRKVNPITHELHIFVTDETINKSKILNPYKFIYGENHA